MSKGMLIAEQIYKDVVDAVTNEKA